MARGVSIDGTVSIATGFSLNVDKSPLIEEGLSTPIAQFMSVGGETVSGTVDLVFRDPGDISDLLGYILGTTELPDGGVDIIVADDNGGVTVEEAFINRIELSANIKDFVRAKYSFIGKHAKSGGTVNTATYNNSTGIFYNTTVTTGSTLLHATAFSLVFDLPIDTEYYILGNPYLFKFWQSGLASVSGSFTISNDEVSAFQTAVGSADYTDTVATNHSPVFGSGNLSIVIGGPSGSTIGTFTVSGGSACNFISADMSASGRNRIEKTINFQVIKASGATITFT